MDTALPTNGQIVVEGYGNVQTAVEKMADYSPVFVSGKERVPLKVKRVNIGAFDISQVILSPTENLKPDKTYSLELNGMSKEDQGSWQMSVLQLLGDRKDVKEFESWLRTIDFGRDVILSWKTQKGMDNTPAVWTAPPTAERGVYRVYGCGPAQFVPIRVPVSDESGLVAISIEARPIGAGWAKESDSRVLEKPISYVLPVVDGKVMVGNKMCSGAFLFEPRGKYSVNMVAIDLAGNESPAPGGAMEIVGPGTQECNKDERPRKLRFDD